MKASFQQAPSKIPSRFRYYLSNWLSYKERRVDALALRADERRDKLRKASGSGKYTLIRRSLNGETWLSKPQSSYGEYIAMRREPGELKHLSSQRKRKQHVISKVAASEMERAQTVVRAPRGCGLHKVLESIAEQFWEI